MAVSTWIASATNSTLNSSVSTFSLQDALLIPTFDGYSNAPFLFEQGCTQEDGSQNCTAACQDYNQIFGSLDTLHNCMVYPTVADLYARRNLSNVPLAKQLSIEPSRIESPLYNNITTTIQKCLIDFCDTLSGCPRALNESGTFFFSPSNITSAFYVYSENDYDVNNDWDFCDYVPKSFNPDIGGIGVYVSYWIQTGLALLSFILVVWLNWGIYYFCFGALLFPRGHSKARKIAQRIRNSSRNKHLPSLTGALAEFQKAQCFFMMAINVAALVNRNSGGFQPNSLQQLYNTYVLIKSISISGYLPVTFTLFTLHLVDVVSWYLLVLSIVTVIVSIATLFVIGSFNPSQKDMDYLSQQAISGGPVTCGSHNLAVYCFRPVSGAYGDSTDPASGAYSMLGFCLVVLVLLVAHQYHAFKDPLTGRPKPWLSKVLKSLFQKGERSLRWVQIGLALISIGLNSYFVNGWFYGYGYYDNWNLYESGQLSNLNTFAFVLFTSCWTFAFVLYSMFTSASPHTRTNKPIGRFFSKKIAFAVDVLSAVFWFAAFVAFADSIRAAACADGPGTICGLVVTNIVVGICACITFIVTTVLAARHMIRTRSERSEKKTHGKHYWIIQRFRDCQLKRRLREKTLSWNYVTRKVPSWGETLHRLPSWTKIPLIADRHTGLQHNTFPTMMSLIHRVHQNVKNHASVLDWPSTLTSAAVVSIYLLFFCLYIYWFAVFIKDLEWFAYNGVAVDSWSFGQVVAITVWAEPLCEYFHLELRGMKRGFEHRLWGYQVVKIKQPDAEIGIVSDPTPSDRSPSGLDPFEDQYPGDHDQLKLVKSSGPTRNGQDFDQDQGDRISSSHEELRRKPVPEPRKTTNDAEERKGATEWQIPETVFLTRESISPF